MLLTRGPSDLGWHTRWAWLARDASLTIAAFEPIIASKHVASSGKGVMVGVPVPTGCTVVIGISASPMGPAIVDDVSVARAWGWGLAVG